MGSEDPIRASRRRYLQAGLAYAAAAVLTIPITLLVPGLLSPQRAEDVRFLLYAVPVVVLIGALIAWGDRAIGWLLGILRLPEAWRGKLGRTVQHGLALALSLTGLGRTVLFLSDGIGQRIEVHSLITTFEPGFEVHLHPGRPQPVFFLNALLTGTYTALLVRAAWLPLLLRRPAAGQA